MAAAESGRRVRERRLVFAMFVNTGLRRNEIETLCWKSLDLDGDRPSLTVEAENAKNREAEPLPLLRELVEELRAWWEECGKPGPSERLFKRVPRGLVHRLKRDLAATDIAYVDDQRRYLDVHALRHTTATMLAKAGVDRRTAQRFMRHSKAELTERVYTDLCLVDESPALEGLPGVGAPPAERTRQRANGLEPSTSSLEGWCSTN